jgi:hypothetical protein
VKLIGKFEIGKEYDSSELDGLRLHVLNEMVNVQSFVQYYGYELARGQSSFVVRWSKGDATWWETNEGKYVTHDPFLVTDSLSNWILTLFLFKSNIKCIKRDLYYQVVEIDSETIDEDMTANEHRALVKRLITTLNIFPIEFKFLDSQNSLTELPAFSVNDIINSDWPFHSYEFFLNFQWKNDCKAANNEELLAILTEFEDRLSNIWFEQVLNYDGNTDTYYREDLDRYHNFGVYIDFEYDQFSGKSKSKYNEMKAFMSQNSEMGLLLTSSKDVCGLDFKICSLGDALKLGVSVYYVDEVERICDALEPTVRNSYDRKRDRYYYSEVPSARDQMGDAFEGDPSNYWNID